MTPRQRKRYCLLTSLLFGCCLPALWCNNQPILTALFGALALILLMKSKSINVLD